MASLRDLGLGLLKTYAERYERQFGVEGVYETAKPKLNAVLGELVPDIRINPIAEAIFKLGAQLDRKRATTLERKINGE